MATLLPADFDLTTLPLSEQRVCQSFIDGLDDTWIVVPHVPIVVAGQDSEIDVVLVSPTRGVVVVEVKGGVIRLEQGKWIQNDKPLPKSPTEQVTKAKHALLNRLKRCQVNMQQLFVCHVVALPDVGSVPADGLGPDAPAEIVFAKTELAYPDIAVDRVLREHEPIPPERLAQFLAALRPDIELDGSEGQVLQWARKQLDTETDLQLASAAGLDTNRRVLVLGGAGTGKTVLVQRWARRAIERGERTLVVCFNRPIADLLQRELGDGALVSTYHDASIRLLEPHGFRIGENPTPEYWRDAITEALAFHADNIGRPFDTIIVDEAQDFYAHWLTSLEHLLDPAGPGKLLMAADPSQSVYVQGWQAPADMVQMPLVFNLRNCGAIAKVVQRLGGPAPLPSAPMGDRVVHLPAGGHKEIRKRVRDSVTRLTTDYGLPLSQIAVLTTHTDVRDRLIENPPDEFGLARWEDRSEDAVLCETVQRTKGLERTAVILVDVSSEPKPVLLYVGVSRAVCSLRLIGLPALAHAAGVTPG